MTTRRWCVVVAVLAVAIAVSLWSATAIARSRALRKLAQVRHAAALDAYADARQRFAGGEESPQAVYQWSRIALDAHRDLADTRSNRLAAARSHLTRMRALVQCCSDQGKLCPSEQTRLAIVYYVREAEYWVAAEQ